ncbi:hypothetical protein TNCT_405501 [Trichonephila clavata]|uniref:Uncharacterized protein n=1 Tax=Trichonephila clavata TaxID=2740835 RepID=A0A8X6KJ09_TRICU|nr:hypothetical protein TNCT_405501 [Trichonephila clavata]
MHCWNWKRRKKQPIVYPSSKEGILLEIKSLASRQLESFDYFGARYRCVLRHVLLPVCARLWHDFKWKEKDKKESDDSF